MVLGTALFIAVLTSSARGVPPNEALMAAAMGTAPAAALAAIGGWAWMTRSLRWVAILCVIVGAAYLWWLFAVAVPANGAFYDGVDPGWNACQAVPEGMVCL